MGYEPPGNWYTTSDAPSQANVASASANNAIFGNGGTLPYTVTRGAPIDVGLMTFQSMGTNGSYTITTSSADPLTIYTGIALNSGSGPVTIGSSSGAGVSFGAANTWTNNSSSLLTVSSNITNSTFGLTVAGSGNTTISGAFVGGTSGGLTMNGTGTPTLNSSAANTYTGTTTINAGTLLENFSNLSSPTNLINSGSALALGGRTLSITGNSSGRNISQTFRQPRE